MTLAHLLLALVVSLDVLLSIPVCVFVLQVGATLVRRVRANAAVSQAPAGRSATTVLVPAHNEEDGIVETVLALLAELAPGDRLLVVADNCTDATALRAREAGAEVTERFHHTARGKGFALAFGIDHLRQDPTSSVVIVDADCELAAGSLDALLFELERRGHPVQARYLMLAAPDAGLSRRLAQFAWRVRNWTRPSGWNRLGMPCQLMGTGMAFTWAMLRDASLANASIVEDMKLGIELAKSGQAPVFCEDALVTSKFPESTAATATQRTRWEHGHLEMMLRELPLMFVQAARRRDRRLFGLALDLAVPPLALLAGLLSANATFGLVAWHLGGQAGGLLSGVALLITLALAVMGAWYVHGRDLVRFVELLSVPWYVASKLPVYLRFVVKRQRAWVRTDRK